MTDTWPEEFRSSMDECNQDRCQHRIYGNPTPGWPDLGHQCHLRPGHPGDCDPTGFSHWEAS